MDVRVSHSYPDGSEPDAWDSEQAGVRCVWFAPEALPPLVTSEGSSR